MLPSRVIRDVRTLYFATVELGFQQRYLSAPQSLGISKDPRQTHEPRFSRPFAVSLGVAAGAITAGLGVVWYLRWQDKDQSVGWKSFFKIQLPQLNASNGQKNRVSHRECRYKDFCSVQFMGEPYMTPRDFLESVTTDEPRQHDRQFINEKDLQSILKRTPSRSKGSPSLFRNMWNDGILTYPDYLFLLTALVKTKRQFEVAFKMIDADGNDCVDLNEFNKVEEAVTKQRTNALIQQRLAKSSLTVHLFGQAGSQKLSSKDFYRFIENLQTEVLDIEFNKFSGGSPTISEEDFARVLLRHTTWDLDPVFERLKRKLKPETGINFSQFCDFCKLLNLLDDFEIAMTMFTIAGSSVTEEEFERAAKICLGKPLDRIVVSTVFSIFDVDGDRKLSYKEFLSVMKSWKLRGFKMREHKSIGGWSEFKTCVKMEMKNR